MAEGETPGTEVSGCGRVASHSAQVHLHNFTPVIIPHSEEGRTSGVGGVQLWRAKHSDHLGWNSKSKDRYGLGLLAMCVVA